MKLYHLPNGEIINAAYDSDLIRMVGNNLPTMTIDEVQDNAAVCKAVVSSLGRVDANGQGKYYIEAGELYERDNWQEAQPNG